MVVGHDILAHRRAQERDLRALEEGADLVLGAQPAHALADQDERPLGLFEQVQRFNDRSKSSGIAWVRNGVACSWSLQRRVFSRNAQPSIMSAMAIDQV
jgi:hypothetical protein